MTSYRLRPFHYHAISMLAIVTAMLSASKVQAQSQQGLPANEQVSPQEQQTTAPTPSQPATSAPEPAAVPSKQQGAAPRAGSDTHLPQILVHGAKIKIGRASCRERV